jgi:uncharacterized protein (TIGR03118 family)
MNLFPTALVIGVAAALPAPAATITQTNLVSDGYTQSTYTDPNLKNPWGISYSPTGPFWVSDNNSGLTTVYVSSGQPQSLVVTIPPASGTGTGSPTGQVYNSNAKDFVVTSNGKSGSAAFIFATEDGTISGWSSSVNPSTAVIAVNQSAEQSVFKGMALYTSNGTTSLYVTDFWAGTVDVYNSSFTLVSQFRDNTLPADWAPYNVAVLNNQIYVTYAKQDAQRHDSVSGKGLGAVEIVSPTGTVMASTSHGTLNAPWGLAIAPSSWGKKLGGSLLVGNFGSGNISVFNATTLKPEGVLKNGKKTIAIDGLWGLIPGNGGSGGAANTIYFSAGPNAETDGLFGSLTYTP